MKTVVLFFLGIFVLSSCDIQIKTGTNDKDESKEGNKFEFKVGDDSDDHGCKKSAGYTWSEVRSECIRLFESGKRYNPIEENTDKAIESTFVVLSKDLKKVELFLPNQKESLMLSQTKIGEYSDKNYLVTDSIISKAQKPIYKIQK